MIESVSVIIPVYNCKDYLKPCIESVAAVNTCANQTFIREIILVDDGSTDGSSELCDELAKDMNSIICKIRVIHQNNKGVSAARNAGMFAAAGSFILFVDSDDTIDSLKLAELLSTVIQDQPQDMIVFGMSFDYYTQTRVYRRELFLPPVSGILTREDLCGMMTRLFDANVISSLCNKLVRKSMIEDAGILLREDMFLYEDLEFSLRALAFCDTVYFCNEPIYHYRQSPDEGNAGRRLKRIEHITDIVDKIEEALVPFQKPERILLSLYLVLAREKISCATIAETEGVCRDFKEWIDGKDLLSRIIENKYAMCLYNGRVYQLLARRTKTKIRHGMANWLKKRIGDFREW